jgi:hypothetical protein
LRTLRILAVAAVAMGAATLPAVSAGAVTLHPTKEFTTPTVTVWTTTGQKVHFSVDMYHDSADTSIDVDLSKGSVMGEDHDWTFETKPSVLAYSKGKGTLTTGTQFGPYGQLKLSFVKVAHSSRNCRNDDNVATSVSNVKAKIKGVVAFVARSSATQNSKWGAIRKGSSTSPYHFRYLYAHYITTTNGACGITAPPAPGTTPSCVAGTTWDGPMAGASSMRFIAGSAQSGGQSLILGMRFVSLGRPMYASRMDIVVTPAPEPVLDTSTGNGVLTVSTQAGTAATGSATLTATAPADVTSAGVCNDTTTSTTKAESLSDYASADFANGSTPLTVASGVGAPISVPDTAGGGAFTVYSYA